MISKEYILNKNVYNKLFTVADSLNQGNTDISVEPGCADNMVQLIGAYNIFSKNVDDYPFISLENRIWGNSGFPMDKLKQSDSIPGNTEEISVDDDVYSMLGAVLSYLNPVDTKGGKYMTPEIRMDVLARLLDFSNGNDNSLFMESFSDILPKVEPIYKDKGRAEKYIDSDIRQLVYDSCMMIWDCGNQHFHLFKGGHDSKTPYFALDGGVKRTLSNLIAYLNQSDNNPKHPLPIYESILSELNGIRSNMCTKYKKGFDSYYSGSKDTKAYYHDLFNHAFSLYMDNPDGMIGICDAEISSTVE